MVISLKLFGCHEWGPVKHSPHGILDKIQVIDLLRLSPKVLSVKLPHWRIKPQVVRPGWRLEAVAIPRPSRNELEDKFVLCVARTLLNCCPIQLVKKHLVAKPLKVILENGRLFGEACVDFIGVQETIK
jgi:hypothetical protein